MAKTKENIWLNLGFNILLPTLLLIKGRKIFEYFGFVPEGIDVVIFVVALAFPLVYGVYDLASRKKWNLFSIIGVLSVALTGGIGLMKFSREWMIIKEGSVPLVLGLAVLITAFTKRPLAKMIMMNESIVDVPKIDAALDKNGTRAEFENALKTATYYVAASFVLSSVLNFILASYIFQSETGTADFNAEVGRMTALSFPVIVVPSMIILIFAMYRLFGAVARLTGYSLEDVMASSGGKGGK